MNEKSLVISATVEMRDEDLVQALRKRGFKILSPEPRPKKKYKVKPRIKHKSWDLVQHGRLTRILFRNVYIDYCRPETKGDKVGFRKDAIISMHTALGKFIRMMGWKESKS